MYHSERLIIRHFELSDAEFIIQLLNDPLFVLYIGDRNVRTIDDAEDYLTRITQSYAQYGFGLSMVMLKDTQTPIGMCGILKRDELELPDLGYALLTEYNGKGYATEACNAVLKDGLENHDVREVLAVTLPNNLASNQLLLKLGFTHQGTQLLYGDDNNLYFRKLSK